MPSSIGVLKNVAALSSASAMNVVVLSLLSLILAKMLSVEAFGITRTATAYMVILTILGHLTTHDALASFIARVDNFKAKQELFSSAGCFVLGVSILVAAGSYFVLQKSGFWTGSTQKILSGIAVCLPLVTLTVLFNTTLQVVGTVRAMALVQAMNAFVPFILILPASLMWQLEGWLVGRVAAFFLIACFSVFLVRRYLSFVCISWSCMCKLLNFTKIQFISGVLSLILMSADIIFLERLTKDMKEVAYYGLAIFFVKAPMFLPTSIGRIYFKRIASGDGAYQIRDYIFLVMAVCMVIALGTYFVAPWVVNKFYEGEYDRSGVFLKHLTIAVVFMGLWQAVSTINIATAKPRRAVIVSFVGALISLILLILLIPKYHGLGAAWAMNIGYASGAIVGIFMIFKDRNNLKKDTH